MKIQQIVCVCVGGGGGGGGGSDLHIQNYNEMNLLKRFKGSNRYSQRHTVHNLEPGPGSGVGRNKATSLHSCQTCRGWMSSHTENLLGPPQNYLRNRHMINKYTTTQNPEGEGNEE